MKLAEHEVHRLSQAACQVRQSAYAPYSKFLVGAALLDEQGALHLGCNVENGSYGLTMCAERVAVGNAVAAHVRSFRAIAIAAQPAVPPCGACRQVLAEFAPDLVVLLVNAAHADQVAQITSLAELLPFRFEL